MPPTVEPNDEHATPLHCPHCGYDLTGLPRDHRCPECGFGFQHEAIHGLALGYADFKLAAYIRVARLSAVAALFALASLWPETSTAPATFAVLLTAPLVALVLTAYWVREVRPMLLSRGGVFAVVLLFLFCGLIPAVLPLILFAAGLVLFLVLTLDFAGQARRFPYARLSLDERWTQELRRYHRGAWAGILAAASALALAWL